MSSAPDAASPVLVFSHANGFPAGTYRQLFEVWRTAGLRVVALDKFGHDERFPISLNWPHLRDQLVERVEREWSGTAVWLVGHSLGGYLSVLAAAHRPELARGVVLLDSPILPPLLGRAVQFAQWSGFGRRYFPSAVSRRRRQHWPDRAAALQHFLTKPAFACWAPGVLQDYVDSVMHDDADGVRLGFEREIESRIYDTLPHHIVGLLRREPLQCPLAFIGGTHSVEVRQVGMRATQRLAAGRIGWLEGGHLFPFERPVETATAVLEWLAQLAGAVPAATGRVGPPPYNRGLPPRPA